MRQLKIFCSKCSVYLHLLLIFEFLCVNNVSGHGWSYGEDGSDDKWTGLCQTGLYQSPIDLTPSTSAIGKLGDITFYQYDENYNGKITNNGHSVAVYLNSQDDNHLRMEGAGLSGIYQLDHMHFHWKSEHTMLYRRYALECHFVHKNLKYKTIKEAIKWPKGIAVVASLFHVSVDDNPSLNKILDEFDDEIREKPGTAKNLTNLISPNNFLPRDRTGFYRYSGSLTTPTCDESVIWTVFTESLPISHEQFERFRALKSDAGELRANNRPIKPINGRLVIYQPAVREMSSEIKFGKSENHQDGVKVQSMGQIFLTSLLSLFAILVNIVHVVLYV